MELDIISGFHADPISLLHRHRTDLAIVGTPEPETNITYFPLFNFEIVAFIGNNHPLNKTIFLQAEHFINETLITFLVLDEMPDIMQQILIPAHISPARRTSELTIAILQLVASGRGIATLPP